MFVGKIFYLQLLLFAFQRVEAIYEKELSTIKLYYTTENEDVEISQDIDIESLGLTPPLSVLIHGWNADHEHMALQPVRDAYLKINRSVINVDWQDISSLPYTLARPLVSRTAGKICELLKTVLDEAQINLDDVHIVGHSLGAHIGGNVGRCFEGKIGRITGLDTAGPLFGKLSLDALSPKDALFVQCIHSGAGALGESNRRGHADFYPNGGMTPQPGCRSLDIITLASCSHYRAPLYFAESILLPDSFPAYECDTIDIIPSPMSCLSPNFKNKNTQWVYMGEFADPMSRGTFFLETNNLFPYGKGMQQI